jgi:hypothetical protein
MYPILSSDNPQDLKHIFEDGTKVDILPWFINVAATKKDLYPQIDKIYKKDVHRFEAAAKASVHYAHPLFTNSMIEKEIYASRILGLLSSALAQRDEPLLTEILNIFSNKWHKIYSLIYENETVLALQVFLESTIRFDRHDLKAESTWFGNMMDWFYSRARYFVPSTDICYIQDFIITLFFSKIFDKKVFLENDLFELSFLEDSVIDFLNHDFSFIATKSCYEDDLSSKSSSLKKRIYIENDFIEEDEFEEDYSLFVLTETAAIISQKENVDLFDPVFDNNIDEKELDFFCTLYLYFHKNQNRMEASKYVMFCMLLTNILRRQKQLKDYYFKNISFSVDTSIDKYITENKQLKEELENTKRTLASVKNDLKSKEAKLAAADKKSREHQLVLERKLSKLTKKLDEIDLDRTELFFLREYAYRHAEDESDQETVEETSGADTSIFNSINALVIGGAEFWQLRLKEVLPHFGFLYGDENFDEALIMNSDIIFLNVACKFRHNFFYKAMNAIKKYEKKFWYVSKTNTYLCLEEMKKGLIANQLIKE